MHSPDLLRITIEPPEDARLIRTAGELDMSSAPALSHELEAARDEAVTTLLDMADVTLFDSTGLHLLLDGSRGADRTDWSFFIVRPSAAVQRLIDVTRTSDLVAVVDPAAAGRIPASDDAGRGRVFPCGGLGDSYSGNAVEASQLSLPVPPTSRGAPMFFHHQDLAYTVRVDKPNPVFARMLQQAIGGPEGELRVMTQYLFQGLGHRGRAKYRDMLLSTATEEMGHIEVLATAVAMNLEGTKSEAVDDVVTNPAVAARMSGLEPRHFLTAGLAATPADANGVPFSAGYIDVAGNLVANMRANVAAEAVGRTLATRLHELTDDPGMKDLLRFLIARDTMHQQQWLAVLEELPVEQATNAPGDFENEEYDEHAYTFLDHLGDRSVDDSARWSAGPSLDGKGEFSVVKPPPPGGERPELQPAPPAVHAGADATGDMPNVFSRFTGRVMDAVDDVTPG
jgi:Mn-containing catalase